MNRRGFLGSILALGAAPAIVSATNLMPIWTPPAFVPVPFPFGSIRECIAYDIERGAMIAHYDVLFSQAQYAVDGFISHTANMREVRGQAIEQLDRHISSRGHSWLDARPLDLPKGMHAVYVSAP